MSLYTVQYNTYLLHTFKINLNLDNSVDEYNLIHPFDVFSPSLVSINLLSLWKHSGRL